MKNLNLKSKIPLNFLFKFFGVSSSTYYFLINKEESKNFKTKKKICEKITKEFEKSDETYGSPRIYQELRKKKVFVSENTVAKYMAEMGLDARHKKTYKVSTTDSNHNHKIAPRLFKVEEEDVLPTEPGKILAGDITYLRLGTGRNFLYLAVVIDLFNREVVGWSMSKSLETKIVLDALDMAMKRTSPDAEVIFHSDRGVQYASETYRKFLKNERIKPSMSRKGNCYDNAYVESWFSSLKKECLYRRNYRSAEELRGLVFRYIEVWYNKKRLHSKLDYQSPEEYRIKHQLA